MKLAIYGIACTGLLGSTLVFTESPRPKTVAHLSFDESGGAYEVGWAQSDNAADSPAFQASLEAIRSGASPPFGGSCDIVYSHKAMGLGWKGQGFFGPAAYRHDIYAVRIAVSRGLAMYSWPDGQLFGVTDDETEAVFSSEVPRITEAIGAELDRSGMHDAAAAVRAGGIDIEAWDRRGVAMFLIPAVPVLVLGPLAIIRWARGR